LQSAPEKPHIRNNAGSAYQDLEHFPNTSRRHRKRAGHYAWRWATQEFTTHDLNSLVWTGKELNGESVFANWKQCFEDAVQFARFAAHIRDRGG
jgi:hypothetical protein